MNIRFAAAVQVLVWGGGGVAISGPKKVDGVIYDGFTAVLYILISLQSAS
jgi:hypothetical protein